MSTLKTISGIFLLAILTSACGQSNMRSKDQAAYPVYIIHMFVLYTGAYFILPLEIPVELKFIFIVLFTGTVSFLLYEFVIRRIHFISPLFGLKGTFQKVQLSNVNPPA